MTTTRHEWATVPKVLTNDLLTQVATIVEGYSVTYGDGGWLAPDRKLWVEPNATLRVDNLSENYARVIDGLILLSARSVGELAIWRTVTELADARLLETGELQSEPEEFDHDKAAANLRHGRY